MFFFKKRERFTHVSSFSCFVIFYYFTHVSRYDHNMMSAFILALTLRDFTVIDKYVEVV